MAGLGGRFDRNTHMGFGLSRNVAEKVTQIALSMGESDDAVVIPDTGDQVLVRQDSRAFLERKDNMRIFKIPVKLKTLIGGVETEKTFFVCTK